MPLTSYPAQQNSHSISSSRVRQNLQPLGIAWCLWGVYRLVAGVVAGFAMHTFARHSMWFGDGSEFVPGFLNAFVPILVVSTIVMSAMAMLTGWSLLKARPWARSLGIIMAILNLIRIPLGTALGIYTLWVLAPRNSGPEYERLSANPPDQA